MSSHVFNFESFAEPVVSIISLLYNKSELTEKYLISLLQNVKIPFQLVLLDNASTDDTSLLLDRVTGALVLRSTSNLQFIKGNNLAAVAATGKYLLFLNNDTEVKSNTVESMIKTIESELNCYAVASKIIFPTGLLQEAGSIVWSNGSCHGYGRGCQPDLPEFNFRRVVDYGSAACLLVRKDKFIEVGGFDNSYAPAYYEDTDLCMKLRKSGGNIVYDPQAEIIHHEYSSSSPEVAVERMQEREVIFFSKWKNELSDHESPNLDNILRARDRRSLKTLLYVDDRIPTPDEGSGWPRAYGILHSLSKNFKITVFPKQDTKQRQPWTLELQKMGVECIYDGRSFEDFSISRKDHYDIIFVSRPHNLEQILPCIKDHFSNSQIVYDAEALFYAREKIKRNLRNINEDENYLESVIKEITLFDHAQLIMLVSEGEARIVRHERAAMGLHELNNIHVIGHGIHPTKALLGFEGRKDLLFIGAFHGDDTPNEDAMLYFLDEVFPMVQQRLGCQLIIAGPNPPKCLIDRQSVSVKVLGFVPDITPLYNSARVFIIPHRFAGGIAWKLSESLANGLPSVCSSLIADQFGFDEDGPVLIGGCAKDFAEKIISLYTDPLIWKNMREKGLDYIAQTHDPEKLEVKLLSAVATL